MAPPRRAFFFVAGKVSGPVSDGHELDDRPGAPDDGIVIQDDYDAVFRYDNRQGRCSADALAGTVALVGSVSKSLAPGLRLGWVVVPPTLVADLCMAKCDDDFGTSVLEQRALARLLANGITTAMYGGCGGTTDSAERSLSMRWNVSSQTPPSRATPPGST